MAKKTTSTAAKKKEQQNRMYKGGQNIANIAQNIVAKRQEKAVDKTGQQYGIRKTAGDYMATRALNAIQDREMLSYRKLLEEEERKRREAEEARKQNMAGNLRSAAQRVNFGGIAGNPIQEKLQKSSLEKILDGLGAKIENEQKIINNQGRAEDDPARIRAEKELKDLEKRQAITKEKLATLPKVENSAFTAGMSNYTPEEEAYIQRLQKKLERGQNKKQTIPAVWKQDLKAIQHMRNTPDKAEGEEYIRWLQEGGEIGLYNKKTTNALIAQAGKSDDPLAQYTTLTPEQKSGWLRNAGKDVRQLLTMRAAKEYNMAHPYTTDRDELLAQQGYYTGLRDEAQSALDRMNGNIRIMYSPDGTEPVEIRGRSNPYYQQNPDAINEQFYDALVGQGEYQKRKAEFTDDPEGWEKADEFELQLTEAWDAYEQGRWNDAYRILTGKNNYAEMESQLGYANDQLNTIQGQLNLYNKYDEFMSGYTGAQRGSYDPGKDRGFDSLVDYGSRNNPNHRPSYRDPNTKDVHRVYSFINQGKEYKAYIQNANGGDENAAKIDAVYGKAALMLPEEIEIFNGYYNAGQYNEASAFLNGLSMALNDRYSKYEEIENREMARKYPVLSSFETLLAEQMSGALAIPRTFAGFAGEQNVYDPNSAWYASTRYTEQTQDEIANMIGGEGGKFYLQGMNTLRNLTNAAMVAAAGVPAAGQAAAGLAMFATQIYQDQTYKYLKETNDYGKAVGMATLDAVLETMEEMLPYETMLKGGGNILLDILKNSTSEALEELTGATVGEAIKGIVEGRQDWEKRRDQIFNEGGYADESGNWIELDSSDSNKALAQAQTQAWKEKGHQIIENTVTGFVGGGLGASYGAARNYLNTRSTGAKVNSKEGGFNTLLEAARGMNENSATRKLAEQLYAKQQKGKNISNYQAGQLAQTMYQESGQEIRDVIEGAMTRKVEGELIKEGASEEYAEKAAPIIAEAVTTGQTMRKADVKIVAKEDAGMILMASYMTGDRNAKESIKAAGGESAIKAREAVRDVLGEKPAKVGPNKGDTAKLRQFAPIAKESDIENAEGPRHDNGLDAVVDGHIVSIKGRSGNDYIVIDENNEKHTVNKNAVRAADERLGLVMEYADRNRHIIDDDTFQEIAFGLKDNKDMDLDDYLAQSTRAYIEYLTGGEVKNSQLAETTLSSLKAHAARMNDVLQEKGLVKPGTQQKVTPGKGTVTYNGIKAGTDEWQAMVKKAGPIKARELQLVAEIGVRLGNQFEIVERKDLPDSFGWEDKETGKIYINLAAESSEKSGRNRSVTTIMAHELTHWLKQNSPEMYKELAQFVYKGLRESNENIVDSVYKKIGNEQAAVDRTISIADALEEIVADACDQVLTNEQTIRQLENESPNLYQKIKTFVRNFIDTVMGYTRNSKGEVITDTSRASYKIRQLGQEFENELTRKWLATRAEALGRQEQNVESGLAEDAAMSDGTETHYGDNVKMSTRVQDKEELSWLEKQKTYKTYKTMQVIDGKLYPPMAAVVAGSMEDASELGQWEKATEHPELIKGGKFTLNKGKGQGSIAAAYNPYMHSSNLMINDQFSGAYNRDNLVTVECEVPASENTSGYHAEYAKDSTGWHSWHTGPVAGQIRQQKGTERQVFLSRWIKPVRIVPNAEVAQHYKELLAGTDIAIPDNVVTPELRKELEKAGVQIKESGRVKYSTREQEEEYKKAQEKYKGKSLYKDSELYDYDFMVSLPNIQIASVQGNISKYLDEKNNIDTKLLRVDGLKNAEQYGTKLPKDQGVAVVNNYTGRIMRITGRTITHSVFNDKPAKAQGNARAGLQAGLLAKIAVPINGLITTEPNVEGTYALAAPIERNGAITGVAIITAEIRSGNVIGLDVYDQAHAISTRKKSGASNGTNAPALTSTKQQAVSTSTSRSSEMSISDFINLVNETYPDILSESIISKLGNNNATGYYKDKKLFSTREAEDQEYMDAVNSGDMVTAQRMVDQAAKAAGYTRKVYHGTPSGGFNTFRDWSYFTENRNYAERYQSASASSIRGVREGGGSRQVYELYMNPGKEFDTRKAKERELFNEARMEYGLTSLDNMSRGLPDWTDGRDIIEYIEDNGLDYDTVILDEGADGGYGEEVRDRGLSYVTKSNMVKSAAPVVYDDAGNVIPLSERFNQEQQDIRYSTREAEDQGIKNMEKALAQPRFMFSMREPVEATKDGLVAVHNIKENEFILTIKEGGLTAPSIAVIFAKTGHNKYGDVSVVFNKDTIDPEKRLDNKVYGADAWTPTRGNAQIATKLNYEVLAAAREKLSNILTGEAKAWELDSHNWINQWLYEDETSNTIDDMIDKAWTNDGVIMAYYLDNGNKLEMQKTRFQNIEGLREEEIPMYNAFLDGLAEAGMRGEFRVDMEKNQIGVKGAMDKFELIAKYKDIFRKGGAQEEKIVSVYDADPNSKLATNVLWRKIVKSYEFLQDGRQIKTTEKDDIRGTAQETRYKINKDEFGKWIKGLVGKALGKRGVYNGRDPFTRSGEKRSFEQLHMEPTAENIVRAMYANHERKGGEAGGATGLMAKASKEYRSIAEVREDAENRLKVMDEEEYKQLVKDLDERINEFVEEAKETAGWDYYTIREMLIDAGGEYARAGEDAVRRYFKRENIKLTEKQIKEALELMKTAQEIPAGYFEAKPERVVGLDEIARVILPASASQELFDAMDERGIPYDTYDGTDADRLEKLNSVENVQFSTREPDMEVNHWMMGLTDSSLRTVQERMLWKQYKGVRLSWELAKHAIHEQNEQLRKLEAKTNKTAMDTFEIEKIKKQIEKWEEKKNEYEEQLLKVTTDKGYAAIMYRERNKMENLLNGQTEDEVRKTIDAIQEELDTVEKEMAERNAKLKELAERENVKIIRNQLNSAGLRRIAAKLKADLGSELQNKEIENRLALLALKMKQGKVDSSEIMELADMLVGSMRPAYDDYVLSELRGMTIALNSSEQETLKNRGMTVRDLQRELTGTGIRVTAGGQNTIDKNWDELAATFPQLDREANPGDMLWGPDADHKGIMDLVEDAIRQQKAMGPDSNQVAAMVLEAASDLVPEILTDAKSMKLIRESMEFIAEINQGTEALDNIENLFNRLRKKNATAKATLGTLENKIVDAIEYNNELAKQHDVTAWRQERRAIIEQLKDKHTKEMLELQEKYRQKIAKDKKARDLMADNNALRREIHMDIAKYRRLIVNETDRENVPEAYKPLAREMLMKIIRNDLAEDRKVTAIDKEKLADAFHFLSGMNARDGRFSLADLQMLPEDVQDEVADALSNIDAGLMQYNDDTKGKDIIENLTKFRDGLEQIAEAVNLITNVINKARSISYMDRERKLDDEAARVIRDLRRTKKEPVGKGSKSINAIRRSVFYGNMTPVYFFKNLKNAGIFSQWEEFEAAENRNGLELTKAKEFFEKVAEDCHYKSWDLDKKYTVSFNNYPMQVTTEQIMALYATWQREKMIGPEESHHLETGGVILDDGSLENGKLRMEKKEQKARKVKDGDMAAMLKLLTTEQKQYVHKIVSYLSKEMSDLGNEASMRMYGIKKYNEKWYFPFKVWNGVLSARSDKGITGTDENRAAHKGWSKRRKNNAGNALVIGNFTDTAVKHVVEMINYNTFAPAIENLNKILNYQTVEVDQNQEEERRNIRVMFQQAYGKEALRYLEDWMKDLQGGVTQDQRKTLRDRLISIFKKNAVAGSLSVTLQQPLSYIRAAMMINPKYLAGALSPQYWKGSYKEMMDHSGVAVIKQMGRFDMNFGKSAQDWIKPQAKPNVYEKISDVLTAAPQAADTMTWTRMWSAVKMEQHAQHPDMDIKSDDFLDLVGKRFNEVMRRTQVYDSTLTKSSNMRSQALSMKLITSFMAEPTLSLNVLADAVMNVKQKGGKATLAKAGATYLLSAVLQAAVKGFMGAGRSPDEKKTAEENLLNKILYNLMSEANPASLIPGYSDLVEVLKNGELKDDALGVLGKLKSIYTTAQNIITNPDNSKGTWRDVEDTAGQIFQLFTNIPLKNLMRDARAMYNWATGSKFADRPTSGAVIKYQGREMLMNGDNLLGVINSWLGDAGYKSTNKAYYSRMYNAMSGGNQSEAEGIREYLELAKGQDAKKIDAGLRTAAREDDSKTPAEVSQWMIDNDLLDGTSSITTQYKKGEITREDAEKLYKAADPKMKDNDVFWKLDQMDYQKETGETETGYYYRLRDAITKNKAEEIKTAVKTLLEHGITKEKIKDKLSDWKAEYIAGDSAKKVQIRDAITKAYKAAGYTADDANKTIERWNKDAKKTEPEKKDKNDTTGRWGRGNIDLNNRKVVENDDGTISTEFSFSVNIDGKEVLLPTVIDGKIVSEEEAIRHYEQTGQYLGKFNTVKEAEEYAEKLHNRQDWYYNQ